MCSKNYPCEVTPRGCRACTAPEPAAPSSTARDSPSWPEQTPVEIISTWLCKLPLVEKSLSELSPHSKLAPIWTRKPMNIALKFNEKLILPAMVDSVRITFQRLIQFCPCSYKGPTTVSLLYTSAFAWPISFQDSLFTFSPWRLHQLSCSAQIFCSVWGVGERGGVNYTERWSAARQPLWCTVSSTHSLLPAVLQLQGSPVGLGAHPSLGPSGNDRIS